MNNTSPSSQRPIGSAFWRNAAIGSIAVNVALLAWLGVAARRAAPASAAPPREAVAPVASPAPQGRARPSGPYAALGSFMAENNRIADLGWTEAQFAAFLEGFRASYEGRGLPLDEDAKKLRDDISRKVQAMLAKEQPNPVEDYFRQLREKEGVSRTASGLHYRVTEEGFGESPRPEDTVVISFAARLPDGQELPKLGRARVRIAVRDLLPGLAEGVQLLKEGGKALIYVPPALAFRDENWPAEVPRGVPVAFFVELHEVDPPAKK